MILGGHFQPPRQMCSKLKLTNYRHGSSVQVMRNRIRLLVQVLHRGHSSDVAGPISRRSSSLLWANRLLPVRLKEGKKQIALLYTVDYTECRSVQL